MDASRNFWDFTEAKGKFNVYFRSPEGKLGQISVGKCDSHKEAILSVKELLVTSGDCLENKAVLAVINGGKA